MGAGRDYGIFLLVFNFVSYSSDIKLNTRKDIPYLQAVMYYFDCYMDIQITFFLFSEDFRLLLKDF